MRYLISGVDEAGRSCVVHEIDPSAERGRTIFRAHEMPLSVPPIEAALRRDLQIDPGGIRWVILHFEPGTHFELHASETVDLDIVLTGTIDLVLETGTHALGPGDGAVINGINHGWQVGPEGCTLSAVVLGAVSR